MWPIFVGFLIGCNSSGPSSITKSQVIEAAARKDIRKICVGLKMPDPELQTFATEQLRIFDAEKITPCLCEELKDPEKGYRDGVAEGLRGEDRNAVASCFVNLVKDPKALTTSRRLEAIYELNQMSAPVVNAALLELAMDETDTPEVRARAIKEIGGYTENIDSVSELFETESPIVKAAVIEALGRHKKEKGARRLIKEAFGHDSAAVRGAAIKAYHGHVGSKADKLVCDAMMEDPAPEVRRAAVQAFEKTKRRAAIRCLRQRALKLEEDQSVRAAIVRSLRLAKGDAEPAANAVLCDALSFWLSNYVEDKLPEEDPSTDIVKTQNDIDHENSERCFAKAVASSAGYSCHAKKYISWYYKQVSGKEDYYVPACPGDPEFEGK